MNVHELSFAILRFLFIFFTQFLKFIFQPLHLIYILTPLLSLSLAPVLELAVDCQVCDGHALTAPVPQPLQVRLQGPLGHFR